MSFLFRLILFFHSLSLCGNSVVTTEGDLRIDWTRQRVGTVAILKSEELSFNQLKNQAELLGVQSIAKNFNSFCEARMLKAATNLTANPRELCAKSSDLTSRSIYTLRVDVDSQRAVRVEMEGGIRGMGLGSPKQGAPPAEQRSTNFSGVVFILKTPVEPSFFYRIVGPDGSVVFDANSVVGDVMMARWFRGPSSGEIRKYLGTRLLSIVVEVAASGDFILNERAWRDVSSSNGLDLMRNTQVANVLPEV